MIKRIANKGQCESCKILVSKQSAARHCQKCYFLSSPVGAVPCFLIKITSDSLLYWLYLSVPAKSTLAEIDDFLRSTWLECCGHLSAFNVNGVHYDSNPEIDGEHLDDMNIEVGSLLVKGMRFYYEYDFGSTTKLHLEVVDVYQTTVNAKYVF